jgi:hypothetical protein
MVSKEDEKKWIRELDNIITTFPQNVISCIVIDFLSGEFIFDTMLTPMCTHGHNHKDFKINEFVTVEPKKITTLQYNLDWIYIPVQQKIKEGKLRICLDISSDYRCDFMFVQNSTQYQTFIGYPLVVPMYLNDFVIRGKCILMTNEMFDHDELICISVDEKKGHVSHQSVSYKKGAFRVCDTLLIGVGYFPQSVTILPCPPEQKIREILTTTTTTDYSCKCEQCFPSSRLIDVYIPHVCMVCNGYATSK